jgi:hypothetical protein
MVSSAAFTSYSVDNDKAFRNAISEAAKQVGNLSIPFKIIAADFYRSQKAIWQLKSPGMYPDLAESTKRDRIRRKQPIYPILFRTGFLRNSLTNPKDPDAIYRVTKTSLTIGTAIPYAIYHQSDSPRKKLPLRKFLFIGSEAPRFANNDQKGRPQRWLGILKDYVFKELERRKIGEPK